MALFMAFCTIVCCLESQHEESATQEWQGKNKQTNRNSHESHDYVSFSVFAESKYWTTESLKGHNFINLEG